jgi:hypothetical protein
MGENPPLIFLSQYVHKKGRIISDPAPKEKTSHSTGYFVLCVLPLRAVPFNIRKKIFSITLLKFSAYIGKKR